MRRRSAFISPVPLLRSRQFAGEIQHTVDVGGYFTVHELTHDRLQKIPTHEHELARIGVMLDGTLTESEEQWSEEFPAGTVIFWSPGSTHEDRFGNDVSRSVHIELSPMLYAKVHTLFPSAPTTALGGELFEGAIRMLLSEVARHDPASSLALEGAIYTVIARASRILTERNAPSFALCRALDYLAHNFQDSIKVTDIGAAVNLSVRRLTARFQEELGVSPTEYLRSLRLDTAAKKLATTDDPVGDIALACGFYDQAHLTREFRRRFGTTPRDYRNRHRSR